MIPCTPTVYYPRMTAAHINSVSIPVASTYMMEINGPLLTNSSLHIHIKRRYAGPFRVDV
jgi:hypothetical protein